ncbi:MAG: GAF domain-containing protein [Magnetococcales bacterium]|nr:GAF domain-containing protein [Magnetococcales bacterium]
MKSFSIKQRLITLPLILVVIAVASISILSLTALIEIAQIMRVKEMANNTRFINNLFMSKERTLLEASQIIARNGHLTESMYYYLKFGGEREPINESLKEIYTRKPIDLMIVTDNKGLGLAYNDDLTRFNYHVNPELFHNILEDRKSHSFIKLIDGKLMIITTTPIFHKMDEESEFVGVFISGHLINSGFLGKIKGNTQIEVASYFNDRVDASTSDFLSDYKMSEDSLEKLKKNRMELDSFQPKSGVSLDLSFFSIREEDGRGKHIATMILAVRSEYIATIQRDTTLKIVAMSLLVVLGIGLIGLRTAKGIIERILELVKVSNSLSAGDMSARVKNPQEDEVGQLGVVFNDMVQKMGEDYWLKENTAKFSAMVQKATSLGELSNSLISTLVPLLDAGTGLFFVFDEPSGEYQLHGSYCGQQITQLSFAPGESLVGQCARENKIILLTKFPEEYIKISSALGDGTPKEIMVIPVSFRDNVVEVIEMASFKSFTPLSKVFIGEVIPIIGLGLENLIRNQKAETYFIGNEFHDKE